MSIEKYLQNIKIPDSDSHKGQNGKLLIIGGSELFHAASKWSLDIASKFVDMVFYSSVPENNELVKKAKGEFWNGIVIPRGEVESYLQEADAVLIGPGMERSSETEQIITTLLKKYPDKKWVIDAGALQMVPPELLNKNHIITPHKNELKILLEKTNTINLSQDDNNPDKNLQLQTQIQSVVVVKGVLDTVLYSDPKTNKSSKIPIPGGNPGMTKGGTGDVLSGLIAALYCKHDVVTSAVVGSYINSLAGDELYKTVGPYFNASDLVEMVPKVIWNAIKKP